MFLLNESTHRMLIRYDPDVGHIFVPGQRARIPNETGGYYVVTNSTGFRSDFEFVIPRGDRPRILMLGCSYTAGDNVDNHERYSDQLAEMLGSEVYNYGVPGTGTDQHLLIYRKFAANVEADLIVLCVHIDSFRRIQLTHRPSVDRVTRRQIMVPKPYFELDDGRLILRHVPVPCERPLRSGDNESVGIKVDTWKETALAWYRRVPYLRVLRYSKPLREPMSRLIAGFLRLREAQPYADVISAETPGWKLMKAILERFIDEVGPRPVMIVPIPAFEFFQPGIKPVYQPLFESLEDKGRGVHVADVSSSLVDLPWKTRQRLCFQHDVHFTPFAHHLVARMMADRIQERRLLPPPETRSRKAASNLSSRVPAPRNHSSIYVLGVSCFYHNSAASLIRDGEIVAAAEEERFTRVKNDRRFPLQAINYCLEEEGISQRDLATIVYYDNAALTFERICHALMAVDREPAEQMWNRIMPSWLRLKLQFPKLIRHLLQYDGLILQGLHHRSHAGSCFYPSPFERAAILTIDGVGEWATASIGVGNGSQIRLLREMRFPHSLGLLYSAFTWFTGFKVNSGDYKMMGLAPYGQPRYVNRILENLVDLKQDGSLQLNLQYFGFLSGVHMTNDHFHRLFDGPRRKPEERITRREMDLARSVQVVTEEAMLRMARTAHALTGEGKLCLAGGVALNCVANGRLLREGPFSELWIQPAAGDAGCAAGVALDVYHSYFGKGRTVRPDGRSMQGGSFLGPSYSDHEIRAYLETFGYRYHQLTGRERSEFLAQQLIDGKVVGHFSGRLEYGPRALGSRSILGDPRNPTMQAELNLRIKYRESFRPFAPAVLAEHVSEYFELDRESPYMLLVAPVRERHRRLLSAGGAPDNDDLLPVVRRVRSDIPAVTHVDYSARIQTVKREDHPVFYDLIETFYRRTGCPLIVNTSFNVRGEPIICSLADAYRCFMRTEMDVLALGDFILLKGEQPSWPECRGEGLESEDVSTEIEQRHPEKLRHRVELLFRNDFWPVAEMLHRKRQVLVDPVFDKTPTEWTEYERPESIRALFELAPELQAEDPDPGKIADELTRCWKRGPAVELLRPVIAKLIRVGLQHGVGTDLHEEVPESVYVMF